MKKLLYVITVILSILAFYNCFSSESYINKAEINTLHYSVGTTVTTKPYIIGVPQSPSSPEVREKTIRAMIEFANEHDLMLTSSKESSVNLTKVNDIFFYTKDKNALDNLQLEENKTMDLSSNTSSYISSDIYDEQATNHFDYVDNIYKNTKRKEIVNIFPMEQFIYIYVNVEQFGIGIICENPDQVKKWIATSSLKEEIPNPETLPVNEILPFEKEQNQSILFALILIIFTLFMLLVLCFVSKRKKEIVIRLLMGIKTSRITRKMFALPLISCIVIYSIIQLVMFYFLCGEPRPVNVRLIKILVGYFVMFVIANIVSYIIASIMIRKSSIASVIKQKKSHQTIVDMSFILKAIMTCFIIAPFLSVIPSAIDTSMEYISLLQQKNEIESFASFSSMDYGSNARKNELEIYEVGNKLGALYEDFSTFELVVNSFDNNDMSGSRYPFIIVNKNYLKDYSLKSEDGQEIILNNYGDKYTYFIPESCDYDITNIEGLNYFDSEQVKIENPNKMYHHDASGLVTALKNPVIALIPDYPKAFYSFGSWIFYVPNESMKSFQKEIDKTELAGRVSFIDNEIPLATTLSDFRYQMIQGGLLLAVYLSTYIAFMYLTISLYFEEHKKRLSLGYLNGRTFFQRYGKFLVLNLSIYGVPLLMSLTWLHLNLWHVLLYILFFGSVEVGIAFYQIYNFQKNGIVNVLKGE